MDTSVVVTEIFHSIQGESSFMGYPCVFVRLTGCPLRCRWCDTDYAFSGGTRLAVDEVLARVAAYNCHVIEVTGGEPLAQGASLELMKRLADAGYTVLLETSGAYPIEDVDPRVHRIVDLKCPDSGEQARNRLENLKHLGPRDELKFVVANRSDYDWARAALDEHRLAGRVRVLFSPVHGELDPKELAAWMLADRVEARFQLQMHKYIWSPETRGV